MLVYLIAALEAAFYLMAVPLNAALRFESRGGPHWGLGLSAFAPGRAARQAGRRLRLLKSRKRRGLSREKLRLVTGFLRALKPEEARLTGRVSLGDAAATALFCGGLNALGQGLRGPAPAVRVNVRPDFSGAARVELQGMIRVRAGQIILAAARTGAVYIGRNMKGRATWTSIPSRTS